jgi:hypothetical protein
LYKVVLMQNHDKYFISYFKVKIIRAEISLFSWACGNDIVNSIKLSAFISIFFLQILKQLTPLSVILTILIMLEKHFSLIRSHLNCVLSIHLYIFIFEIPHNIGQQSINPLALLFVHSKQLAKDLISYDIFDWNSYYWKFCCHYTFFAFL